MSLLQMSFSGGVMILAITVIRALALNKLPKRTFFILWMAAALRLLVPVSIPSPVSVYSLAETAELAEIVSPVQPTAVMQGGTAPAYVSVDIDETRGLEIPLWQTLWGTGTLLCAAFFAVSYIRCRRSFRQSLPVENEAAAQWLAGHRLRRSVELRRCAAVSAPLTYGVFRPVILLPEAVDWGEPAAYVLEHELVHIRWFDAAWKLVLAAAVCVHWWNPLAWVMYVLANRDIELSCDEAVVRRFGLSKRSAYAMTLISMEESRSGLPPLASGFSKNAIEERITAIMKMKKTSVIAVILAVVLVCGLSVGFATSAAEKEFTKAESQRLQSLRFDGYWDMTVADYQKKMWEARDNPADMALIERYGERYVNSAGEDALDLYDYFFTVYEPLTAEKWQNRSFSGAAAGPDGALLEYNYEVTILDRDTLLVGEYESIHPAVREAMDALAADGDSTPEFDTLEDQLSNDRVLVTVTDFVFQPAGLQDTEEDARQMDSQSSADSWGEILAPYIPFGLTYEFDDPDHDGNGLTMYYQGREVRGIVDGGTWITEHSGNGLYSADAIELYTDYQNGRLAGLRPATAEEQAEWDRIREQNRRSADVDLSVPASERDPREFPHAAAEDYESFLELMKWELPVNSAINLSESIRYRDYQDVTLAEFNTRLLDWGNNHQDAYDRIMCDVLNDDYAVELSEEEKRFVALTCNLSGTENAMYVRSNYTGRPEEDPGFSENLPEFTVAENGITVAWCDLYYQCSYHIADKSAVTVRERDAVISGFRQGIQEFWDETDTDKLLRMSEEQVAERLNGIAKECSTDSVQVIPMTADDVHFAVMDERGHD